MYKYAFVLGRVYTLSIAEIFAILPELHPHDVKVLDASLEVLVIEASAQMDVEKFQRILGGTVKILKVIDVIQKREQDSINFALQHYFKPSKLKNDFLKGYSGKVQFGVSVYLLDTQVKAFGEPKRLGMFIKRGLQDSGMSIRLVIPEFNSLALASVVVTKNLLLTKGAEICILAGINTVYTAKTLAVQDFEDYGRRDYQRPVRDDKQGMIPPKVAQIMINLAGLKPGDTIVDPFCGLATLVQEGVLLGYKVLGSDINPSAITGSEKNLEWFRNRYKIAKGKYHVEQSDAKNVNDLVTKLINIGAFKEIKAVVTEGTLGPIYGKYPKPNEIKKNFEDLKSLYTGAFQEFLKFLPQGGKVVICVPAYRKGLSRYEMFESFDFIKELGYNMLDVVPKEVAEAFGFLKLTERGTAIYDRTDQIVAREIVIFEKK